MLKSNRCRSARFTARALAAAAGLTIAGTHAANAATVVTWTGLGGNSNWSNPLNWSPQVVPVNGGGNEYSVVIPASVTVVVDSAMPVTFTVNSVVLPQTATLRALTGRTLSLSTDTGLNGIVEAQGGSIIVTPPGGSPSSSINGTIFTVSSAGQFRSAASSYSLVDRGNATLRTNGAGSLLDLSSVQTLTWGTSDPTDITFQGLEANNGIVDLSGLTTLTRAASGYLSLNAYNGGIIRMPQITALTHCIIQISGTAQLQTGTLTSIDHSTISVSEAGASFTTPASLTNYTMGRSARLFSTSGAGSSLNLASIQTMNLGTTVSSDVVSSEVRAQGGVLNLSGLTAVTLAPNLRLSVNAYQSGLINLSSLTTLRNADFDIRTGGTIDAASLVTIDGSTLRTESGLLSMPSVASYSMGAQRSFVLFADSSGTGSIIRLDGLTAMTLDRSNGGLETLASNNGRIDMPALASITGAPGTAVAFNANSGGVINLGALASVSSVITSFNVTGTGSRITAPSLTALDYSAAATRPVVSVNTGLLDLSSVSVLRNADVRVAAGTLNLGQLTAIDNTSFTIGDASLTTSSTLSSVTYSNFSGTALSIQNGTLSLPGLANMTIGSDTTPGRTVDLIARAGGTLNLPSLAAVSSVGGGRARITVSNGGQILMPGLLSLPGDSTLTVSGATSILSVPSLTSLSSPGGLTVTASSSGVLDLSQAPVLQHLTQLTLSATTNGQIRLNNLSAIGAANNVITLESGGQINLAAMTTLQNAAVTIRNVGSTLTTGALSSFDNSTLTLSDSAAYTSPATLQNYTSSTGNTAIFSAASSSTLNLASLTSLTLGSLDAPNRNHSVSANGGIINLSGVTNVQAVANARLSLSASGGGSILLNSLATLPGGFSAQSTDAGSVINLLSATSIGNGDSASFSAQSAGAVVRLDNLTGLGSGTGRSFSMINGGSIQIGALANLGGANSVSFTSNGAATTFSLSALMNLGSGTGRTFVSGNGAVLDIPSLATLGGAANINISVSGTNSRVSLPSLTSIGGGTGRIFSVLNSSQISMPLVHELLNADVTIRNAGQLQTGVLTSIDGSTFFVGDGASYATPAGLTAYSAPSRSTGRIFEAVGAGSTLNLSSLTSLGFGNATNFGTVHTVSASAGGLVDLRNVTALNSVNGGVVEFKALQNGGINLSALQQANRAHISIDATSQVNLGAITSFDGSSVEVTSAGFALPAGVTSYSALDRGTATLFSANLTGSLINLSSLQTFSFGSTATPGVTHSIGTFAGVVDLTGLSSFSRTNGGLLLLSVSGGGIIKAPGITDLRHTALSISAASSQIQLGAITTIDGGALLVSSGATFTTPAAVASYSALDRPLSTIFSATGTGSQLNLASIHSLTYGSTANAGVTHSIIADVGVVDLSGVTSFARVNGGFLGLTSISAGRIDLSGATSLENATVHMSSGSGGPGGTRLATGVLTSFDGTTLNLSGQAVFNIPAGLTTYDSNDRGTSALFVTRTNGRANLGSLTSMSLGSATTPGAEFTISALNNGMVDLHSVTSINMRNNASMVLSASSDSSTAATIDLSSLTALNNATTSVSGATSRVLLNSVTFARGSSFAALSGANISLPQLLTLETGDLPPGNLLQAVENSRIDATALRSMTVGSMTAPNVNQTIRATSGSIDLRSLDTITIVNGGSLQIVSIDGPIRLVSLTASPSLTLSLQSSTPLIDNLTLSGSLRNEATSPTQFDAVRGVIRFNGGARGILEAAGQNLGTAGRSTDNNGNFGIGTLILGGGGLAAFVEVNDLFNNGFRGTIGTESLYIYNNLLLLSGSRLYLNEGVHVYAWINGVITDLRTLIPAGQTQVAFSGGFIVIPAPTAAAAFALVGLFASRRRRA